MTELGVGYISIVPETKAIGPGIDKALTSAQGGATKAGQGMGSKIAGGIGTTLKAGALAAGAVAGLAIGTALTQGMGRLVAIDDAKGKLAGLGHDAQSIATIMDSALASVKGTAFGLGDAATVAASAVAAGIKPGEELTKYLTLTGDAATIAGTSLEEMGSVINKVQTSGSAYTDNLNQLADRGIPIFQWLQEEYGVTADGLSDMVKEGQVDAETFKKVIEENIGGAALESGATLRGSFENMKAALGRVGESALKPFAQMAKDSFGGVGGFADKLGPKVEAMSTKVATGLTQLIGAFKSSGDSVEGSGTTWERFGSRLRTVTDGIQGVFSILTKGDFKGADMTFGLEEDSKVVDILFRIRDGAIGAYQAISRFFSGDAGAQISATMSSISSAGSSASDTLGNVGSLSERLGGVFDQLTAAGATVGSSLLGLGGDTATVVAAGISALGSAMSFAADNTGLLGVALGGVAVSMAAAQVVETGYQAARIATAIMMPAQIAAQMALTRALGAHTLALRADIVANGSAVPAEQAGIIARSRAAVVTGAQTAAQRVRTAATIAETSALGAYATAQRLAAANSGLLVGGLRNTAAGAATAAGSMAALTTAAGSKLRSGLSSTVGMLGGPWGVGILAATGLAIGFASAHSKINKNIDASNQSLENSTRNFAEYRTAVTEALNKSGGQADSSVRAAVSTQIQNIESDLRGAAERTPSMWQKITAGAENLVTFGQSSAMDDVLQLDKLGTQGQRAAAALDDLGMSQADISRAVTGSSGEYYKLLGSLEAAGGGASGLSAKVRDVRETFVEAQSSASRVGDSLMEINSGAATAAGGVDGLTNSLRALRDDSLTVEDAQAKTTLAMSRFAEAAGEAGRGAFDAGGRIDTTSTAGAKLHSEMLAVSDAFLQSGSAAYESAFAVSNNVAAAASAAEAAGTRIREDFITQRIEAGYTRAEAEALAEQYRLFPDEIPTAIKIDAAQAKVDADRFFTEQQNKKLDWYVNLISPNPTGPVSTPARNAGELLLPGRATGGRLPSSGPGTDTTDGFLAVGENGVPIARVDAGEWVVNERSSNKYDRELAAINAGTFPKLPGYEDGGRVAAVTASDLLSFVNGSQSQPLTGSEYDWGGTKWGDCSGAMSAIARFAVGLPAFAARFATATMGSALSALGFSSGLGGLGDLNFGWLNGGPGGGHTAGTLPDGTNVEMGGSYGGGMVGGGVGAASSQFTDHAHLPIGGSSLSGSSARDTSRKRPEWTEAQQLDLDAAGVAITRAEESRTKIESEVADGKKTQADLDAANIKVQQAQQKVTDLQAKKDDVASWAPEGPAPQAPGLSKAFTDSEIDRLDAQLAVESANERRNEAYDDPDSTPLELAKVDAELYKAQEELKKAGSKTDAGASEMPSSWSELLGGVAKDFVSGQVEDALGVFGVPNDMPDFIKAGVMLNDALVGRAGEGDRTRTGPVVADPGMATPLDKFGDANLKDIPLQPFDPTGLGALGRAANDAVGGLDALLGRGDYTAQLGRVAGTEEDSPVITAYFDGRRELAEAAMRQWTAARGYKDGGPVSGTSGVDKIPAWLTNEEFVVNSRDSQRGQNPTILQAMNAGADFMLGRPDSGKQAPIRHTEYHLHGITDADDAMRRVRIQERMNQFTHVGTESL